MDFIFEQVFGTFVHTSKITSVKCEDYHEDKPTSYVCTTTDGTEVRLNEIDFRLATGQVIPAESGYWAYKIREYGGKQVILEAGPVIAWVITSNPLHWPLPITPLGPVTHDPGRANYAIRCPNGKWCRGNGVLSDEEADMLFGAITT